MHLIVQLRSMIGSHPEQQATSCNPLTISIQHLTKHFVGNDHACFADLNLEIAAGQLHVLVGPSGCGKTTLLNILGGLDTASSGNITFMDPNSPTSPVRPSNIGICFQQARLLPWCSVEDNIGLPLQLRGIPQSQRQTQIMQVLQDIGLPSQGSLYPYQLSGGMAMRVALARALLNKPPVLLLDEPFGALDDITREQLDQHVLALRLQHPMTTLLITHNVSEAVFMGDFIHILSPQPGKLIGTVEVLATQRNQAFRNSKEFFHQCQEVQKLLHHGTHGELD